MTQHAPRLPALARRSIPVAVPSPVQLCLGLRWDHPIDHVHAAPGPEPVTLVALHRRRAAA